MLKAMLMPTLKVKYLLLKLIQKTLNQLLLKEPLRLLPKALLKFRLQLKMLKEKQQKSLPQLNLMLKVVQMLKLLLMEKLL
jgi:hypothetical protein